MLHSACLKGLALEALELKSKQLSKEIFFSYEVLEDKKNKHPARR